MDDALFDGIGLDPRDPPKERIYRAALVRDEAEVSRLLDEHRAAHGEPEQQAYIERHRQDDVDHNRYPHANPGFRVPGSPMDELVAQRDEARAEHLFQQMNECRDPKELRSLLDQGADPNAVNLFDETPLLRLLRTTPANADDAQVVACIDMLVAAGADPGYRTEQGNTPLHYAQTEARTRALLAAGADATATNNEGHTALHQAHDNGSVRALLRAGASIDATDSLGNTPLHECARKGRVEAIDALLMCGADTELRNRFGDAPAYLASLTCDPDVVERVKAPGAYRAEQIAKALDAWTPPVKGETLADLQQATMVVQVQRRRL